MRTVLLSTLLLAGCPSPAPETPAPTPTPETPAPAPQTPASDAAAASPAPSAERALTGTVIETMDAARYTYIQLDTADGPAWAAVGQAAVQAGQAVRITRVSWMQDFHSKTLDRTFDTIAFGQLDQADAPGAAGPPPVRGPGGRGPSPVTAPVPRAEGDTAHTVAEVYAHKADLAGSKVRIRGQVVKFTAGVMNTNWMHIQDGSGSAASGNDDMTVTTDDTVAVGELVVVEGQVVTDRDLGAGYRYDVLVEGATVSQ